VIDDLSSSLRAVLEDPGLATRFPELAAAQISFERPAETFTPGQTTVDLFLFAVRENVELRENQPSTTRLDGQVAIRRPPLRVDCCYLVTAWPRGAVEPSLHEQQLLSQVLQVFAALPTIPPAFLQGVLAGQPLPVPLQVAHPDGPAILADFWTALGSPLRPAFSLAATLAVPVGAPVLAPATITHDVRLEQLGLPATEVRFLRIGGRVTDATDAAVVGATVVVVERDLGTTTDGEGRFRLGSVAPGTYTLRVTLGAVSQQVPITVPAPSGSSYDVHIP